MHFLESYPQEVNHREYYSCETEMIAHHPALLVSPQKRILVTLCYSFQLGCDINDITKTGFAFAFRSLLT